MSSSRLPGKVLKPLPWGTQDTVLQQVIRRCQAAAGVDEVIVATSDAPEDQAIVTVARSEGVAWVRGPLDNVLQRYVMAVEQFQLDRVVRITSDCPCLDPQILSDALTLSLDVDYIATAPPRTFPHGIDLEIMPGYLLLEADRQAQTSFEREHVTPWIHTTQKAYLQKHILQAPSQFNKPGIRVTLDTAEDYALLCVVFQALYHQNPLFGLKELVSLFQSQPWLYDINHTTRQKLLNPSWLEEQQEAIHVLRLQELHRAANALEAITCPDNF